MRVEVAAEAPGEEGAGEEGDGGEGEGAAKGAEGAAIKVEEVTEGEGVVAGVLLEEDGEIDAGVGGRAGDGEEGGDKGGERAEDKEGEGDALSGAEAVLAEREGGCLFGFAVEPAGDEEDERREGGEHVVLLSGGKGEEEHDGGGPEAEEEAGGFEGGEGCGLRIHRNNSPLMTRLSWMPRPAVIRA